MYLFTFDTLICYTIIHVLHCMHNFVRCETQGNRIIALDKRKSQAFLSRKQQTQNNKLLYCTGTTLSWITLHDGSQHWHHHDHQYWHNIGAAPALTLAHSLAQHDHKLMIKTNVFVTIFVLFCFLFFVFVPCCGFLNRKVCPHGCLALSFGNYGQLGRFSWRRRWRFDLF